MTADQQPTHTFHPMSHDHCLQECSEEGTETDKASSRGLDVAGSTRRASAHTRCSHGSSRTRAACTRAGSAARRSAGNDLNSGAVVCANDDGHALVVHGARARENEGSNAAADCGDSGRERLSSNDSGLRGDNRGLSGDDGGLRGRDREHAGYDTQGVGLRQEGEGWVGVGS